MGSIFFIPVLLLYLGGKGVDFGGFLAIHAISRCVGALLDVPAGILADRWDRRRQIMAAASFWTVGMGALVLADGFWQVAGADALCAIGSCLLSGTAEAYLHEALAATGRLAETTKWQTRLVAWNQASQVGAAFTGPTLCLAA